MPALRPGEHEERPSEHAVFRPQGRQMDGPLRWAASSAGVLGPRRGLGAGRFPRPPPYLTSNIDSPTTNGLILSGPLQSPLGQLISLPRHC